MVILDLLNKSEKLIVFDLEDFIIIFESEPLSEIRSNFNIENINTFDVLDFDFYGDDILLSTRREGIFLVSSDGKVNDLLISEKSINNFKYIGDDRIIITINRVSDTNVKIYDDISIIDEFDYSLEQRLWSPNILSELLEIK